MSKPNGEDIDILGARAIIARVSGWIESNDQPVGDWAPLVEDIARNLKAIRAHRPATAPQPEGGEWWHDENGWVYLVSNEEGRDNYETVGHIDLLEDCAEIVRIHNASLAAAQRNEKLWRAEWEQISETARVLQEKLTTARADADKATQKENIL